LLLSPHPTQHQEREESEREKVQTIERERERQIADRQMDTWSGRFGRIGKRGPERKESEAITIQVSHRITHFVEPV